MSTFSQPETGNAGRGGAARARPSRKMKRPRVSLNIANPLQCTSPVKPRPAGMLSWDRAAGNFPVRPVKALILMQNPEYAVVQRECRAIQIPEGTPSLLSPGTRVRITQSLGGTYTVSTDRGHL